MNAEKVQSTLGEYILVSEDEKETVDLEKHKKKKSGVRILLLYSRQDIRNPVSELSKANIGPSQAHNKKMLKMVKFVIKTKNKALKFELDDEDNKR